MKLTDHQQELLDGKHGKGASLAMQIQVAIGEGFRAKRMVPISRAHVALSAQEADTWFAEKMLNAGAECKISPTVNPGYCLPYFQKLQYINDESSSLMQKTHKVYQKLGATLTYSCTPYLFGNIPRYGEIVSFSETSVSVYANSVIGAKTHREGSSSSLCAAITGYVPEYGMLLNENRLGDVLVQVEAPLKCDFDFALLGLTAGKIGNGVPVFTGIAPNVTTEALISLGTQLNVAGVCDMYHIVGVTPDARSAEQAFGGNKPKRAVVITEEDLQTSRNTLKQPKSGKLDFVMLGCPHYTYAQLVQVEALLERKHAKATIWILTSGAVKNLAAQTGLEHSLQLAGVRIIPDTCVDQSACWRHLADKSGITDSPKCAYYMHAFGVDLPVCDIHTCIRWALGGEIHNE